MYEKKKMVVVHISGKPGPFLLPGSKSRHGRTGDMGPGMKSDMGAEMRAEMGLDMRAEMRLEMRQDMSQGSSRSQGAWNQRQDRI